MQTSLSLIFVTEYLQIIGGGLTAWIDQLMRWTTILEKKTSLLVLTYGEEGPMVVDNFLVTR